MKDVTDLHIEANIPLPTPGEFLEEIPRSEVQAAFVAESRHQIAEILFQNDPRLLLVVGPCSIHDTKAGLEYAERLRGLAEQVSEKIFIVMRAYFEKPRTTLGWKGLIMDPHLDGTDDIPEGLRQARRFLREVIDLGVPTATELLDPITPQYIADFICWSAIGARTTESQTHRQMASGLSMPVGFKNSTPGSLAPAINAILAATQPQTFLGISPQGVASTVRTRGNPHCHIILRGGSKGPNYASQHVAETEERLTKAGLPPTLMIDCSHGNSDKDHNRQPIVLQDILTQRQAGNRSITGIMMESNLKAGNQKFPSQETLNYGQSITDACIDWKTTERVILEVAEAM
ncbi:MAG: 3-deoxy-7-phosphoheptulonate synthase [Verrucomicrobiota bacterium]